MSKKRQYKSEAFAAVHETMDALHQIGAIGKKTMRDFDKSCLAVSCTGTRSGRAVGKD